jgi:ribosomal protein L1
MKSEKLVENVKASIDTVVGKVINGSWRNIKCIHIKTAESASISLYDSN